MAGKTAADAASMVGEAALNGLSQALTPTIQEKQLKRLKISLLGVQSLFNKAETQQFTEKSARSWVGDLTGLTYDMADIVDEMNYELLRLQLEDRNKSDEEQPGNSTTASLYGSSSQSAGSTSSIFGSSSQPASSTASIFGFGSQRATATASIFGSSSQPASSCPSIFGTNSQSTTSTSNLFGSSSQHANSISSVFGSTSSISGSSSQPANSNNTGIFGLNSRPASSVYAFASSSRSPSTGFSFGFSTTSTSNIFGSSSQHANSTSSVFGSTSSIFGSSSQPANSNTGIFGLNSRPASSVFSFDSSPRSPSTGFSLGFSIMPTGNRPLTFGSSSISPTSSFNSSTSGTSTIPFSSGRSMFQMSSVPVSFGAASPSNDRMNVEDTVQASTMQAVSSFGQPASSHSPFMFPSTSVQSGGQRVFLFDGLAAPQNSSSRFAAAAGNLEVAPGRSFSPETASTDKSNRKMFRIRRDRHRRK
ncbi:nuclear pore complex protein NUP62-like [Aristolochia californica]|uniref:nuclear pore complex protein NUP62-like n=1 Tax=Aristolochia californica TaxID=171875 RepID=UPI0035D7D1C8